MVVYLAHCLPLRCSYSIDASGAARPDVNLVTPIEDPNLPGFCPSHKRLEKECSLVDETVGLEDV